MMSDEVKNQGESPGDQGIGGIVNTREIAAAVDQFLDQFNEGNRGGKKEKAGPEKEPRKNEPLVNVPLKSESPASQLAADNPPASNPPADNPPASSPPGSEPQQTAESPAGAFADAGKESEEKSQEKKEKRKPLPQRLGFRIFVCFATFLTLLAGTFFGAVAMINYGPSASARDLFVTSVLETSAAKFLATMYFSDEEIAEIKANNQVVELEEITDTSLINIDQDPERTEEEDIVIEDVYGDTFKGKMMIVRDPGRLFVGTSVDRYDKTVRGKTVQEIIDRYNGVAGVNAGGFVDENGKGDGSIPLGIVISRGQLKWGSKSAAYEIIGFDNEDKFVIGKMTGQEALDRGIRDAVSFGPLLIVNGQVLEVKGFGGGLNPRTAIGQRADGAVLLLVCDGRQGNSLGASMSDVIDLMVSYGAVNAANLDGGSSTVLYHQGQLQNVCCSLYGPRDMPNAIVVGALEGGEAQ